MVLIVWEKVAHFVRHHPCFRSSTTGYKSVWVRCEGIRSAYKDKKQASELKLVMMRR